MRDPITRQAATTPNKLALRHTTGDFTFADLAGRIAAAQRFFAGQHLSPRSVAATCVANLADGWVIGMALRTLGVTTMAIANPLDLTAHVITSVDVLVISSGELHAGLDQVRQVRVIRVPTDLSARARPAGASARPARPGGHILFTSGTTGTARQLVIDERTAPAHLGSRAAAFDLEGEAVLNIFDWGLWTSLGFLLPFKVWELGGTVMIRQPPDFGPADLMASPTHAIVTPVMLSNALRAAPPPRRLERMRLFVGGGPLPAALAAEALARVTTRLYTVAASTEAGVWTVTPIVSPQDTASHLPAPGRRIEIVDEADQPVEPGQVGAIRVDALAEVNAYHRDPEATLSAFRDGYFYPGDLGVIDLDGRLSFRGRASDLISAANQKVAPEPIEDLVAARLGVEAVCAFSCDAGALSEELHLAIQTQASIPREQLEALALSAFSSFSKVHFHIVADLPRNDRGKLQRFLVRQRFLGGG
jgi:acyl-coenzyme A synthetase/AMP-(fatty) acid ligase